LSIKPSPTPRLKGKKKNTDKIIEEIKTHYFLMEYI